MNADAMSPDHVLAAAAGTQFGCFTIEQAHAAGFSRAAVSSRLRRGAWRAVYPGIYAAATSPRSRALEATAARLRVGPGASFSEFTAARLLGMDVRQSDDRIWVRAPWTSGQRDWPGVRVTRSRHPTYSVVAAGQPVVPPARTIVDLAGRVDEQTLTGLIYDVHRRRLVSVEEVGAEAEAIGGGLRGLRSLRRVLAAFDPAFEAMVEALVGDALVAADIPLTPQYEVWDGPFLVARLDFADEALRMGVEVDGFRYHGSRDAQRRDRARDRALHALGWTISRFDAADALERLPSVVREVDAVRRRLLLDSRRVS